MASDIKANYNETNRDYDINFANGDFEIEDGLETSVFMSLFTDRRAEVGDKLLNPSSTDRRGWWGDAVEENGDQIGSRLWLLNRSKATTEVLNLAKQYIEEALEWMVEDGVVQEIEVEAEWQGEPFNQRLAVKIIIRKSDGTTEAVKFDDLWEAMYAV